MSVITKISNGGTTYDIRDKIIGIIGSGAPTTATVGTVGQIYEDSTNGVLYICKTAGSGSYSWEEVGTDPILYSTTGQNTDGAMTQKATTDNLTAITDKIPSQASSSNQLADKSFVNSSIATNTANFLGTLDAETDLGLTYGATTAQIVTALNAYSFASKTNNDYCFVVNEDANGNVIYQRFKYVATGTTFGYEYTLNNSSFTAVQWSTINSGLTSTDKTKLDGIAAGAEVNVQSDWNQTDTTADDYIKNKPNIPSGVTLYSTTGQNTDGAMTQKAATNEYAKYLPLAGGTMTGALNMGSHTISAVLTPSSDYEAANKKYVDDNLVSITVQGETLTIL